MPLCLVSELQIIPGARLRGPRPLNCCLAISQELAPLGHDAACLGRTCCIEIELEFLWLLLRQVQGDKHRIRVFR